MFTRLDLKHLSLKNRIIRSATNEHLADAQGHVTPELIEVYRTLASENVGLIFTSHMCVRVGGRGDNRQIMIDRDDCIEGLSRLTEAVHDAGGLVAAQLNHAGAQIRANANPPGSMITSSTEAQPEQMSQDDIADVVSAFANAAVRAKKAGFDGVQVHIAHGYLLTEFLDPVTNHRRDGYGGSTANRFRIVREVIDSIRTLCGDDYPVFVKINCNSKLNKEYDFVRIAKMLDGLGIEAMELSGFDFGSFDKAYMKPYYAEQALAVKKAVSTPVFIAGGFHDAQTIRAALESGIDGASLSRAFIREPDFASKLLADRSCVSKCVHCSKCYSVYSTLYKRCIFDKTESVQLRQNYGA